jgi:RNA polymerase sigma factor FliA
MEVQVVAMTAKQDLMERGMKIVNVLASKIAARGAATIVDRDDLVQAGSIGLLQAMRTFDPTRGIGFSSYAGKRILGAMLDELRESDWLTRGARAKVKSGAGGPSMVSINAVIGHRDGSRDQSLVELLPDREHSGVSLDEHDEFQHLIRRLPRRERLLLTLMYEFGLDQVTAATSLGYHPSGICQTHTRAIEILKAEVL